MAKDRPSRLRPLTLRLLTALARAHLKKRGFDLLLVSVPLFSIIINQLAGRAVVARTIRGHRVQVSQMPPLVPLLPPDKLALLFPGTMPLEWHQ